MSAPLPPAPTSGEPAGADPQRRDGRPKIADAITIALELWIVVLVGQIVAHIARFPAARDDWPEVVAQSLGEDTPRETRELYESLTTFTVGYVMFALVGCLVALGLMWLVREGYGWARVALGALGAVVTVNMVRALFVGVEPTWATLPLIVSGVAALGASILLLMPQSDKYCRDMARFRKDKLAQNFANRNVGGPPGRWPTQHHFLAPSGLASNGLTSNGLAPNAVGVPGHPVGRAIQTDALTERITPVTWSRDELPAPSEDELVRQPWDEVPPPAPADRIVVGSDTVTPPEETVPVPRWKLLMEANPPSSRGRHRRAAPESEATSAGSGSNSDGGSDSDDGGNDTGVQT